MSTVQATEGDSLRPAARFPIVAVFSALAALIGLSACSSFVTSGGQPSVESGTTDLDESAASTSLDPSTSMSATSTTRPMVIGDRSVYGFILPRRGENVGSPGYPDLSGLAPYAGVDSSAVTIDDAFLDANEGESWLTNQNGRWTISGVAFDGSCLNILVSVTLENSYVNCPTRTHDEEEWGRGFDDAPAVNVVADGVTLRRNTITCSGFDNDICSRNLSLRGADAVVEFNDLSFARGAIQIGENSDIRFNFIHSLAFGADDRQNEENNNPGVTHNNALNNYGASGACVVGNYVIASYGRVSASPEDHRNQYYTDIYPDGIVGIGDPLNGYTIVNYLIDGSGADFVIESNYLEKSGRAFQCQTRGRRDASCAAVVNTNAFGANQFERFGDGGAFAVSGGPAILEGRCNFTIADPLDPEPVVLPPFLFAGENHEIEGCDVLP